MAKAHGIDAVVRDAAVKTAGYQGTPEPNQWFGGPEMTTNAVAFGRFNLSFRHGSVVLRDASGLVVDSLNYGGLVDPWAAEGYQGVSGKEQSGCYLPSPGAGIGFGPAAAAGATNASAGRFPDGADSDSNCNDFLVQASGTLAAAASAGATNIKMSSVEGFSAGQKVMIDTGANQETAEIATVGTAGATTAGAATTEGGTEIPVASATGFRDGQAINIDTGANAEAAVIASIRRFPTAVVVVSAPLAHAHATGAEVAGTGITLTSGLTREHAGGAQVADHAPTPGAPNEYAKQAH